MLVAVVVIQLYFALSSAQPSQQCSIAYNATFSNFEMISCAEAYYSLVSGSATEDQTMMVCNTGQQCNGMIENIVSTCGHEVRIGFVVNYIHQLFILTLTFVTFMFVAHCVAICVYSYNYIASLLTK